MMDAPASSAARATAALDVSMEISAEVRSRNFAITGNTRANSSSAETGAAPGRVDSPPTSMICRALRRHADTVLDGFLGREKLAAVRKRIRGDIEHSHDQGVLREIDRAAGDFPERSHPFR